MHEKFFKKIELLLNILPTTIKNQEIQDALQRFFTKVLAITIFTTVLMVLGYKHALTRIHYIHYHIQTFKHP